MLASHGLIQVRHGVGLFGSGSSVQPVSDALSLLLQRERVGPAALVEARQLLEVEIAGLAISEAVRQPLAESMRATYPVDGGPAHWQREHALVFEAVRDGDAAAARRSMAAMLSTSARALGVRARPVTGTARVTDGNARAKTHTKPRRAPRVDGHA